ncbi:hypothetical protein A2336_01365 [Candidatus Peregrinibacteria bacterium RIFOXYB2_FULL_41_88]|nr:MAG: hypothetical protein A2336_01365 [Candidatus Peregrinibacteria bacterium RIFOXYB2_FULL_41_88]
MIESLSLLWVVYTFVFLYSEQAISIKLRCLQRALSVDQHGSFRNDQFCVKQELNFNEIKEMMSDPGMTNDIYKNLVNNFDKKLSRLNKARFLLFMNLYLVSLSIIINELFFRCGSFSFQVVISVWLIFSFCLLPIINLFLMLLLKLKLSGFVVDSTANF